MVTCLGAGSMTTFGTALRKLLEPVTPKAAVASASVKCSNASDVSDEDGGLGKAQHALALVAKPPSTGRKRSACWAQCWTWARRQRSTQ